MFFFQFEDKETFVVKQDNVIVGLISTGFVANVFMWRTVLYIEILLTITTRYSILRKCFVNHYFKKNNNFYKMTRQLIEEHDVLCSSKGNLFCS